MTLPQPGSGTSSHSFSPLLDVLVQIEVADAGLDQRVAELLVHLEDAIHATEVEHDRAREHRRRAAVGEILAARDGPQRDAELIGDLDDLLHLLSGIRRNRGARLVAAFVVGDRVRIVVTLDRLAGKHPVFADDFPEPLQRIRHPLFGYAWRKGSAIASPRFSFGRGAHRPQDKVLVEPGDLQIHWAGSPTRIAAQNGTTLSSRHAGAARAAWRAPNSRATRDVTLDRDVPVEAGHARRGDGPSRIVRRRMRSRPVEDAASADSYGHSSVANKVAAEPPTKCLLFIVSKRPYLPKPIFRIDTPDGNGSSNRECARALQRTGLTGRQCTDTILPSVDTPFSSNASTATWYPTPTLSARTSRLVHGRRKPGNTDSNDPA